MLSNNYKELNSNWIFMIKGLAIISVVSAHTVSQNIFISRLFNYIGVIGVPVFFFISGYLFNKKKSMLDMIKKKFKYIGVPWIICGTLTFFINSIFGSEKMNINILTYLRYIIGDGSHLYYLTILFIFYFIFYNLISTRKKALITVCIVINIISIILSSYLYKVGVNPYLNPCNFIMYFCFGFVTRSKDIIFIKNRDKVSVYAILIQVLLIIIGITKNIPISYFTLYGVVLAIISIIICYPKNEKIKIFPNVLVSIGRNSFLIYLLHLPVVGVLNLLFKDSIMICIVPIIVVLLMTVILDVIKKSSILKNKIYLVGLK